MTVLTLKSVLLLACVYIADSAAAQGPGHKDANTYVKRHFQNFTVNYDFGNITCVGRDSRNYLNLALTHEFDYNQIEAHRWFKEGISRDPTCAALQWGYAYSLGPFQNEPHVLDDEDRRRLAHERATQAKRILTASTEKYFPKEVLLINAIQRRYQTGPTWNETLASIQYAEDMRDAYGKLRSDDDISVVYAEAELMKSTYIHGGYYTPDQLSAYEPVAEAVQALEDVIERDSIHPHAHHMYIHAVEGSLPVAGMNTGPERGLQSADFLYFGKLYHDFAHLVHMPGHIYMHTGRFTDVIETNKIAYNAVLEQLARPQVSYGPCHATYQLVYGAIMDGQYDIVLDYGNKLMGLYQNPAADCWTDLPNTNTAWNFKWLSMVRFSHTKSDMQEVLAADLFHPPADPNGVTHSLAYNDALGHHARMHAYAALGDKDNAKKEMDLVQQKAIEAEDDAKNDSTFVFEMARMLPLVTEARYVYMNGDAEKASDLLKQAVDIQDSLGYDEPPKFYYPVRHCLGHVLLQQNAQEKQALDVFDRDLVTFPKNAYSLLGRAMAMEQLGTYPTFIINAAYRAAEKAWENSELPLLNPCQHFEPIVNP